MKILLKTLTYGAIHITVATSVAYAFTGNIAASFGIGLVEPVIQTFVFALHEWIWEGKKPKKVFLHH